MDWSQIVSLSFQGVLAIFTGGLVFATVCLWRSTKRYADATDKLLRSQQLHFVDALYYRINNSHTDRHARALVDVEEGRDIQQFTNVEKEKWEELCEKTAKAYIL